MKKFKKFISLDNGAILAPMADYTNVAFRTLAREYGASLAYTELISVKGLLHKSKKTKKMLAVSEKEKPVFLQLFGNKPIDFKNAVKMIEDNYSNNFAGYDINCGCSVPKAIRGNYGSSLMNDSNLIAKIIDGMSEVTNKPITLKIRLGLLDETFLDVAKKAEQAGASAITLHARFGFQGYSGVANWEKIKELKQNVNIAVIGNGDIKTFLDYKNVKENFLVDYVMVGRATIGNAFLFKQIREFEDGVLLEKISVRTKEEIFFEGKRFLELIKEFNLGVNDARGYFLGLVSGLNNAKEMRLGFALSKSVADLENNFNKYFS